MKAAALALLRWCGVMLVVSVSSAAELQAQSADDALFACPTRIDRIGRILVPVMINGRGPFRLVMDTGASHSTISPHLARLLGMTPEVDKPVIVNGVTGTEQLPSVTIERLQAGEVVIEHVQVPVVETAMLANADGVLGVAGLTHERILADFQNNRVVINHSHNRDALAGFVRIPANRVEEGILLISARVGGVNVVAVIDTGSERTLGNLALRDALHARHRIRDATFTDVYGATSAVSSGEVALAPVISMGGAQINEVEMVYGDFHIFEVWKLLDRPAVIVGMDVLGSVPALAIDFARSELYLKRDAGTLAIVPSPHFGR